MWVLYIQFGYIEINQNKTLYIETAIYRVFHERSSITAPFAEDIKSQEKKTFNHLLWVKRGKTQQLKLN